GEEIGEDVLGRERERQAADPQSRDQGGDLNSEGVERRQSEDRSENQFAEKFERIESGRGGRVEPRPPLAPVDPEIDRRGNPEGHLEEDRDHRDSAENTFQAERQANGERAEAERHGEQQETP